MRRKRISALSAAHGRFIFLSILFVSILCGIPSTAFSEEEEVQFESDYQQQVQDEKILILQGNCKVVFRQYTIYADEIRLNDEKDEFFGTGNVRLMSADRDIFADSIWYNYARDDFDLRNARGSMVASGVSEVLWFEAERLKGNVNDFKLINSRITTCSPDERREYHLEAQSIKVLKDNKVIFRNGYFFALNVPILWFPYWAFSLEETPWEIQAGKSFDGVYVKTKYNYLAEELIVGYLVLEYYSRKGWVTGSNHNYVLPKHGQGNVNWIYRYETQRNNTDGSVSHNNEYTINVSQAFRFGKANEMNGNISLRTTSDYNVGRGRTNDTNGRLNFSYNIGEGRTNFTFSGRTQSGDSHSGNISTQLQYSNTFFKDVTSSVQFDYQTQKNQGISSDEEFLTHIEFRQNKKDWNWNAVIDSRWDPDGDNNLSDRNKRYTDKLPEINLTIQPTAFPSNLRNWLGFQMSSLNLIGALYYIGPEVMAGDLDAEVNGFYGKMDTRFTRNDDLGKSHKLQTNLDYWQAISSTGDARYTYGSQVNWTWDLATKLKWQVNWSRNDSEGRIPFQGKDNPSSPSNRLAWSLNYTNGRLYTIRFSTNYVLNESFAQAKNELFSIKRLQPLQVSLNYTLGSKLNATFSTQYDFVRRDIGSIRTTLTLTDLRSYRIQSSMNFEPPGTVTTFSNRAQFMIGEDWSFDMDTEFAPKAAKGDVLRNLQVTHWFDCTFIVFSYRAAQNEWFVTWAITGYPQASLSYNTTRNTFGPDFFNTFSGSGSGFGAGGGNFGGFY